MARRVPEGPPPPPTVQRVRVKYTKSGRLRFTSHRDFARALERALRRAEVPIAFSAGFSPHPKISYIGAAPTGVSSAAEYLELGLAQAVDLDTLRVRLDAALPDGLDVIEVVPAGPGSLAERIEASAWRIELAPTPGITAAVEAFLASSSVLVERLTKDGRREIDARAAVISLVFGTGESGPAPSRVRSAVDDGERAILELVVRQATPAVRPDDVLAALASLGALLPSEPARASRLAQGPLEPDGTVGDPLATDRA
jgi:radical SAM-linked protein